MILPIQFTGDYYCHLATGTRGRAAAAAACGGCDCSGGALAMDAGGQEGFHVDAKEGWEFVSAPVGPGEPPKVTPSRPYLDPI